MGIPKGHPVTHALQADLQGVSSQGVLCVHFEAGSTSANHIIMYYDGLYLRIRALKLLLYSCPLFYQICYKRGFLHLRIAYGL